MRILGISWTLTTVFLTEVVRHLVLSWQQAVGAMYWRINWTITYRPFFAFGAGVHLDLTSKKGLMWMTDWISTHLFSYCFGIKTNMR